MAAPSRPTDRCWDSRLEENNWATNCHLPAGENKVKFSAWLRSFVPVDHLQVICNGEVVRDLKLNGDGETADVEDTISISQQRMVPVAGLEREGGASDSGYVSLRDDQSDLCDGRGVESQACTKTPHTSSPGSIA